MNNSIEQNILGQPLYEQLSEDDIRLFKFNYEVARCIVKQRNRKGFTQEVLAERSGVNRTTIARLERFQRTASIDILLKLFNALDMDLIVVDRNVEDSDNEKSK